MKVKSFLRCPNCDGKIVIRNKEVNEVGFVQMVLPESNYPVCECCGRRYVITINSEKYLEIEIRGV